MERVNMPNDDFREKLTVGETERVCAAHDLPTPKTIVSERRGNDKVAYHLDERYFLAFVLGGDMSSSSRFLPMRRTHYVLVPSLTTSGASRC